MSDSIKVKAISFTAEYKEEYAFLKKARKRKQIGM